MLIHAVALAGLSSACGAPVLAASDIIQVALNNGFPLDVATQMTAIALRESAGCPTAYNGGNPPGAESSYGLWQINLKGNPGLLAQMGLQDPTALFDPDLNAQAAFRLWGGKPQNLDANWYITRPGYQAGYEAWLPAAVAAANQINPGGPQLNVAQFEGTDSQNPLGSGAGVALGAPAGLLLSGALPGWALAALGGLVVVAVVAGLANR